MSRYTIDQREAIMATARATLERPVERYMPLAEPDEDALTRWRREGDEAAQQVAHEDAAREAKPPLRRLAALEQQLADVRAEMPALIDQRIAAEHEFMVAVIDAALADLRVMIEDSVRKEFADELQTARTETAKLAAQCAEQKVAICELRIELADRGGKVLDLPALPLRGSRVN